MRNFAALLLSLLLIATQVLLVQAVEIDSGATLLDKFAPRSEDTVNPLPDLLPEPASPEDSGAVELDKFTGEVISAENAVLGGNQIQINNTVSYDREKRAFIHSSLRDQIYSNVASGMIVAEPVWIIIPEGLLFRLYKNGELLENVSYAEISEPGAYTLVSAEADSGGEIMRFTIVSPVTGKISRFQVPDGFVISSAMCNGSSIATERTYVDMVLEGDYDISYRCPVTEAVYMFRVTVDHTPPVLALAEVGEDGTAKGPVDISDLEPDAQIGIWLNEREIEYEPVLTQSGRYRIVVTDAAGNMSSYEFMIRVYFTTSSIILFIAILAVGVGLGIYALYSRRHMRIR